MMSAGKSKLCFYEYDKQIAAAFKVDCEEFLLEFEKLKSLRFSEFAKVWHLKNFTFVYSGQKYALLLRELCEDYFYIVKKFLMSSDNVFEQVGAFYLLYGLYYKQPLKGWIKIRLTLEEYTKISDLMELMRGRREYEPVYIFAKMKIDQAFLYTALQRPLGPEDRFVKSYETYLDYTFNCSKKDDTLMKFNEIVRDGDLVRDMEQTNAEYQDLMRRYAAKCPSVTQFSSTIMNDLEEAYLEVQRNESSVQPEPPEEVEKKVRISRKAIKEKAMANKNAVYRGKRSVKMAIDLDFGDSVERDSSSDIDDDM